MMCAKSGATSASHGQRRRLELPTAHKAYQTRAFSAAELLPPAADPWASSSGAHEQRATYGIWRQHSGNARALR